MALSDLFKNSFSGVALISTESAESAELLRRAQRPRRPRNDRGIFLEIRRVISPSKFDGKLENTFLGRGYCYFSLLWACLTTLVIKLFSFLKSVLFTLGSWVFICDSGACLAWVQRVQQLPQIFEIVTFASTFSLKTLNILTLYFIRIGKIWTMHPKELQS